MPPLATSFIHRSTAFSLAATLSAMALHTTVSAAQGAAQAPVPRRPMPTIEGNDSATAASKGVTILKLPKGDPPSGVTAAAAGPAAIRLQWNAPPGATGYRICRHGPGGEWVGCTDLPGTVTDRTEDHLYPGTAYEFGVFAQYPGVMSGLSIVQATTAGDAPVTGLAAAAEGEGAVRLTWDAVPSAIGYCVVRDGDVCVGDSPVIRTTSYVDRGLQPRTYRYGVIAMYASPDGSGIGDPLSMYGPGEPWKAARQVSVSLARYRGTYRISIPGFRVHHETWDHVLEVDGKRDEVIARADVFRVDQKTGQVDTNTVSTRVMGDINLREWIGKRVKEGSASDLGGIMTGDDVPAGPAWQLHGQPGADSLPLVIWEGELTRDSNQVVVVPTLWEHDGGQDAFNDWVRWLHDVPNKLKSNATFKQIAGDSASSFLDLASLGMDIALDLPEDQVTGASVLGVNIGKAQDRPIGMQTAAAAGGKRNFTFMPKAFVIDLARAERELATTVGGKSGVIAIPYRDDPFLWGDYELYLKIERVSP
jgi:hypothetical protein